MRSVASALSFAILSVMLVGCGSAVPSASPTSEATHAIATRASISESGPTQTDQPTLTPMITSTPLPTVAASQEAAVPSPLPTDQRNYQLCVSIASDSNGYGHVTFQRPDTGQVVITYITPVAVPLQAHLNALGLSYLPVIDHSESAGGLTIATSNYLESSQFYLLKQDHCEFVIVTAFIPDVAVNLSGPNYYIQNLAILLQGIAQSSPGSRILLLNYYQTDRADFTANNSGRGLNADRINAFNDAIAKACASGGAVAKFSQVTCIDIRHFFDGMDSPFVLGKTTKADYEAALYRTNTYSQILDDYFAKNPNGYITGDGIHLSLAGRDRLAERLAQIILDAIKKP